MFTFCHLTKQEYNDFQANHPNANFMNSPEAMELKEADGWKVEYVGVKENGQIVCASNLTSIPVMKIYRYFYAQRGFLMDFANQELISFFTKELKKYCRTQKGLYLVVDPNVFYKERDIDGNIVEDGYDNSFVVENLEKVGFQHQGFTLGYDTVAWVRWIFTLYINGRSKEQLLKDFHQQTRWSINKTIKQGIEVRELGLDEIDIFLDMMDETAVRRGFESREHDFYKKQIEIFKDKGKLLVAYLDVDAFQKRLDEEKEDLDKQMEDIQQKLAEIPNSKKFIKKQKVVQEALDLNTKKQQEAKELKEKYGSIVNMATSFFILCNNEVTYMHSATNDVFRKYYAPYALQWHMIQYAVDHGMNRYDFYGISGNFDKEDPGYGVYDFKKGFTGVVEELVGDFILPIRPVAYKLYKTLKG